MEEMLRARCEEKGGALTPSPGAPPSVPLSLLQLGISSNPFLLGVHGGFSTEAPLITSLAIGD